MAKCKYCHESISRLDKEVCPFCGGLKPLDGTDTSTQDVTKVIDQLENPVEIRHKKRLIALLLAIFCGFLGLDQFYLGKHKKGFITLTISLLLICGIGSILFFAVKWHSPLAFLIPYFVIECYCLYLALCYLTNNSIQDAYGEFLE